MQTSLEISLHLTASMPPRTESQWWTERPMTTSHRYRHWLVSSATQARRPCAASAAATIARATDCHCESAESWSHSPWPNESSRRKGSATK